MKFVYKEQKLNIGIILFFILNAIIWPQGIGLAQGYRQPPKRVGIEEIKPADYEMDAYLPLLKGKRTGLIIHESSRIGQVFLADTLIKQGIKVTRLFAPEHGIRGKQEAGEEVSGGKDKLTGLPVVSLYGSQKVPKQADLKDLDVLVFDLQDVGARFFTYISTLHYVMEACAQHNKLLIVLDRPNPNGYYVDGPVLDTAYRSFVGMHPVPIVHGMTIGEYAGMINGEKWLKNGIQCPLKVITMKGWNHRLRYVLPLAPSPNLADETAILLYPSLCLFEGTAISVGRGTSKPFRLIGHPGLTEYDTTFTPLAIPGVSAHPPHEGKLCKGFLLDTFAMEILVFQRRFDLGWIMRMYQLFPDKPQFFNAFFKNLAGNNTLRGQMESGKSEIEIRQSWQPELNQFKQRRKQYLLYEDF